LTVDVPTYRAPVDDWVFLLTEFLRIQDRTDLFGPDRIDAAGISSLIEEAARFHEEVLLPLALNGDREGAALVDGRVVTPSGFQEAWSRYRAAGWPFLSVPVELGGGGMPPIFAAIISEMRISTAHSFATYGAFCYAAATMIGEFGTPWMRSHIAPRIAVGDWTATMCLTESHAGSDLRQIQTRAIPQADGTWHINGEKIFISGGDHDLTENIVHLVLAKVPDANGQIANTLDSIGVFIVPKLLVDPATGNVGDANAVTVTSIEHKMGIEGSATCTLAFDSALGWRILDDTSSGLAESMGPMFFLMNKARVSTAMSGVAYAELSHQVARAYARERLSGRAPGGSTHPDLPADPIIDQPDVRRHLLTARSFAEGGRALGLRVALLQSEAENLDSSSSRAIVELMTPVMKAFFTDRGFDAANTCLQVFGGHGYIRDYGIEQIVRNARVGQIYEGTNGIQARDLMRLLTKNDPDRTSPFFDAVAATIERAKHASITADLTDPVDAAAQALQDAIALLSTMDESERAAVAYDVLTAFGLLAVAWTWLDILIVATSSNRSDLMESKEALAHVWIGRELPLVHAHIARVHAGSSGMPASSAPYL
jgi:alkylation response protein AidB-like acyl-CoA dehydrogenase